MAAAHSGSRRAFTLIELLVVISIIALLISMLLPSLGSARRAARGSQCRSNLHGLSTAATSYAADSTGMFPFAKWRNGDGWPAAEVPYSDGPLSMYSVPWSNYAWMHIGQDRQPLMCPSSPESKSHPQFVVTPNGQVLGDYPINGFISGFGGAGGSVTLPGFRIEAVRSPSFTFLFVDGAFIALESYRDFPWMMGRHEDRMNAAHVDGHVEDYRRFDWDYSDNQLPGGAQGEADFSSRPDKLYAGNFQWHLGPSGPKVGWADNTPCP